MNAETEIQEAQDAFTRFIMMPYPLISVHIITCGGPSPSFGKESIKYAQESSKSDTYRHFPKTVEAAKCVSAIYKY